MSLLLTDHNPEFGRLINEIYTRQLEEDREVSEKLNAQARQKMYQDVTYNVDFLYTSMCLEDDGIFARYAVWLYQLLCHLMTYCTREQLRDSMIIHYELIRTVIEQTISEEEKPKLNRILDYAIQATIKECAGKQEYRADAGIYKKEIKQYLDCLLHADSKGAMRLVAEFGKNGIPLSDLCVDIIAEAMRQVGDLWHRHLISVDMEHYCTSVTQMALTQFYPLIFSQKRKEKSIVVACVGSELHEIGARMVADLFEYNGWDSIYLGAAVPVDVLVSEVAEHSPCLAALSVTMPQHLPLCRDAVRRLKRMFPDTRIAVGGNAFADTEIWKDWGADICTGDARELVQWADKIL